MLMGVKLAVVKSGRRGYEIAQALHWHPTKLSSIISETYVPDSLEKEDLAAELNSTVEELFHQKDQAIA